MYRGEILDEKQLSKIIKDEIGGPLKEIADAIKPKEKTNYLLGILWGIAGLAVMYVLYIMFKMLDNTMGM